MPLREKNRPKTKAEINFSLKEMIYLIDFDMRSTNVGRLYQQSVPTKRNIDFSPHKILECSANMNFYLLKSKYVHTYA